MKMSEKGERCPAWRVLLHALVVRVPTSVQEAKPSLSQRSSHQFIVTRFPNPVSYIEKGRGGGDEGEMDGIGQGRQDMRDKKGGEGHCLATRTHTPPASQPASQPASKPAGRHSRPSLPPPLRCPPLGPRYSHWCASSWATTVAMRCFCWLDALRSSISRSTSRYVTRPQFSIAPMANSGMATWGGEGRRRCMLAKAGRGCLSHAVPVGPHPVPGGSIEAGGHAKHKAQQRDNATHHVELGQGVGDGEEVVVEVQRVRRHHQGEAALLRLARRRVHAHRHAVLCRVLSRHSRSMGGGGRGAAQSVGWSVLLPHTQTRHISTPHPSPPAQSRTPPRRRPGGRWT